MRHIGLDVHAKKTMVAWLDDETGEVSRKPYEVATDKLAEVLIALPGPKRVAMEVGGISLFLAPQLEALGIAVLVADAFQSSRLLEAKHRAKTDALDAHSLMELLHDGQLDSCAVWVADERTQALRDLTRTREALVQDTTRLRNRIRQLLARRGARCSSTNLLGKVAQRELDEIEAHWAAEPARCLHELRASLHGVRASVRELEKALRQAARGHDQVRRLQTLFGCATLTAVTLVAEIGDITRFVDATHLRGYSGLTPRVRRSAERSWTGPLDKKRGNPHLRRILVLLAGQFSRYLKGHDCPLARRYGRCFALHGPNPAKVALARNLCDIIFAMWRQERDFDPARLGVGPEKADPPLPVGLPAAPVPAPRRGKTSARQASG